MDGPVAHFRHRAACGTRTGGWRGFGAGLLVRWWVPNASAGHLKESLKYLKAPFSALPRLVGRLVPSAAAAASQHQPQLRHVRT